MTKKKPEQIIMTIKFEDRFYKAFDPIRDMILKYDKFAEVMIMSQATEAVKDLIQQADIDISMPPTDPPNSIDNTIDNIFKPEPEQEPMTEEDIEIMNQRLQEQEEDKPKGRRNFTKKPEQGQV